MMVLNCGGEEGIESKIFPGYFLDLLTPLILLYRDWNKGSRWRFLGEESRTWLPVNR